MRRLVTWVFCALALAFGGYLLAANVLLMTSWGGRFASSQRTQVSWRSGYSIVPTRIHLTDLTVRVRGAHASWVVTAARADATISLGALFRGRFHARSAEVAGVAIDSEDVDRGGQHGPSPLARTPPPIDLVRIRPGADRDQREDEGRGANDRAPDDAMVLDDLSMVDVHDVHVGSVRYHGKATLRGALSFRSDAVLRLRNATVGVPAGEVDADGEMLLREVHGTLSLTDDGIDLHAPASEAWLSPTDATLDVDASVKATRLLGPTGMAVPEAPCALHLHLRIVNGAVAAGSSASLRVPPTPPAAGSRPFDAEAQLSVEEGGAAKVTGVVHGVAYRAAESVLVDAGEVRFEAHSPRLRLAALREGVDGSADVKDARIDLSTLPLLGTLVHGEPDALLGDGHLEVVGGVVSGHVTAHAETLALSLGDREIAGAMTLGATLHPWKPHASKLQFSARASYTGGGADAGTSGSLSLDDAVVTNGALRQLDGAATVEISSALPVLDAITGKAKLPDFLAAVAGSQPLHATAALHAEAGGVTLRDIQATAGFLHVRGAYAKHGEGKQATLLLEGGPLTLGMSVDGPRTTLMFAGARKWFDEQPIPE